MYTPSIKSPKFIFLDIIVGGEDWAKEVEIEIQNEDLVGGIGGGEDYGEDYDGDSEGVDER